MWEEQEKLRDIEQENLNQYGRKQEKIYLVIPAYEPDGRLVDLLSQAEKTGKFRMIVVNDGSSRKYDMVFEEAEFYATVLNHLQNQGKESALKTALQYIQATDGKGYVVTADADGQHALPDILSVAEYCQNHPEALVLGWAKRDAPIREIPIENWISGIAFLLLAVVVEVRTSKRRRWRKQKRSVV